MLVCAVELRYCHPMPTLHGVALCARYMAVCPFQVCLQILSTSLLSLKERLYTQAGENKMIQCNVIPLW